MGALRVAGEGEQQAFRLRVGVLVAREEFNVSYIISVSCLGAHSLFFGMANISLSCHVLGVQSLPLAGGVGGARYTPSSLHRLEASFGLGLAACAWAVPAAAVGVAVLIILANARRVCA